MANDPNRPYDEQRRLEGHDPQRLSDGREALGDQLARPVGRDERALGEDFAERNASDGPRLGDEFADANYAEDQRLGQSFADPNSLDDTRIGKSFAETNSSAKKHHRPVVETVEAPFKKPGAMKVALWIIGIVLVLAVIALIVGYVPRHNTQKEADQRADQEKQNPQIEVTKVTRSKSAAGLVVPGTTTPLTVSSVYARSNGYLKRRYVDIGDKVHKGQLLAIIDAPDLDQQVDQARQQVSQAEAQVAQQQTQLALTKITVDRYRVLVAKGVFSRQDGDQREADYQAQRANVASAERNVEAFKANLGRVIALQSYERVTAPFDGVITQRNVDAGDLISVSGSAGGSAPTPAPTGTFSSGANANGSTNTGGSSGSGSSLATPSTGTGGQGGALFSIAQMDRLRIFVSVPEGYSSMVRTGQRAELHFQELGDTPFFGDVTRTAGSIDQNTRTLLVEVQVDNRAGRLMAGMYAVVTFPGAKGSEQDGGGGPLLVSGDAIAIRKDQPTAALIQNDKISLVPVTIGRDLGAVVEVVGGLKEGDVVASTFTDDVVQGATVRTKMSDSQIAQPKQQVIKPNPPGGSTQYGDPGVIDQDMGGQNAKPQQKAPGGGAKKATGKGSGQ